MTERRGVNLYDSDKLTRSERQAEQSMWPKIDLAGLYADALTSLPDDMDDQPPLPAPWTCPVTLDELFREP